MKYQVGIDLGTTYTAAALHREGKASIFSLGDRAASIPSVVLLREDETVLTGEAAVRRAMSEPERVAREFKRRLGDSTPIIVGGSPYSAEALMARLLRVVLAQVAAREGAEPTRVAVSHPANWGPFKHDLFRQALRLADLDPDQVLTLSEPEAAAISYANQERIEEGQIVAVYDLGGGTFDACVLRRTAEGFEIIGKPEGIERLGGIDFDAAVFAHVARSLDGALSDLDPDDPVATSAVSRLRADCVDAKEALSSDTDATIPVLLPNLQTEVRLTRREFEAMIRPSLADSIDTMRRAVRSAGVELDEVAKVLLVGGSSRIPLVGQMVSSELGRPVAVDAHPKHAIAIGAAYAAAAAVGDAQGPTGQAVAPIPGPAPAVSQPASVAPQAAAPPASAPLPSAPLPSAPAPLSAAPPAARPPAQAAPAPAASAPAPKPAPPAARAPMGPPESPSRPSAGNPASTAASDPSRPPTPVPDRVEVESVTTDTTVTSGKRLPVLVGVGAVALLAFGGGFWALTRGGDDPVAAGDGPPASSEPVTSEPQDSVPADSVPVDEPTTTPAETPVDDSAIELAAQAALDANAYDTVQVSVAAGVATLAGEIGQSDQITLENSIKAVDGVDALATTDLAILADDEWCSPAIKAEKRWACINEAFWDGDKVHVQYDFEDDDEVFDVGFGFHMHFFPSDVPPENAGMAGLASKGNIPGPGWELYDQPGPFASSLITKIPEKYCVRIANGSHALESLSSGNCWPVEDQSG